MIRLIDLELDDGSMLKCYSLPELAIHEGDLCVASLGRMVEYGRIARMIESDSEDIDIQNVPRVLRRATLQDTSRARENALYLKMVTDTCRKRVEEHKLELQIVGVRHSFDRKLVTITYTAEERVEFQEFVAELAKELHARIEMKQIGVRDAAGIIGGMGPCGRCLCCSSWLKEFEAVSVRMAKNQRLSLSPNTISGVCGRLKCCLHYENECYTCLSRKLPREGTMVTCPEGRGCVVDKNILGQKVKVRLDDNRVKEFEASEVVQ